MGKTDLELSAIVHGAMYRGREDDEETMIAAIDAAIDAGASTIDTAPLYGFGRSERIVGRAIVGCRDDVRLLTKVGLRWDDDHGDVLFEADHQNGTRRVVRKNSRPESVCLEVERGIERLGVETINLVQVHLP